MNMDYLEIALRREETDSRVKDCSGITKSYKMNLCSSTITRSHHCRRNVRRMSSCSDQLIIISIYTSVFFYSMQHLFSHLFIHLSSHVSSSGRARLSISLTIG